LEKEINHVASLDQNAVRRRQRAIYLRYSLGAARSRCGLHPRFARVERELQRHPDGRADERHFKNVTAQIDFMPGDLAKSHVEVAVQSASVDAGSAQTNALLAGADWLAAKADPQARFVSSQFTPDGTGTLLG
jgi:Uncharacterized conserved protein